MTNILSFILLFYGLYEILKIVFKLPSNLKVNRINKVIFKEKTEKDAVIIKYEEWAKSLAKHIKISSIKKEQMNKQFKFLNLDMTPEEYVAKNLLMSVTFFLLGIIADLLLGKKLLFTSIFGIFSILFFIEENKKILKKITEKKESIDEEMYSFVTTISQELKIDRNIIRIFSNYKKIARKELRKELEICIADMQTGNSQKALLNLERRNNSALLSEVVRGLISTINGDDNTTYFNSLGVKFQMISLNLEREKAKKISSKMMLPQISIFIIIVVYILLACGIGMNGNMGGMM